MSDQSPYGMQESDDDDDQDEEESYVREIEMSEKSGGGLRR